ncbi:Telomerase reverse transcriptase, partial [Friedmanniomyces endolithicus]
ANLIRIDKRYYRQKRGIPQGSIVSSLLCSYLYAGLERDVLGFLAEGQTLLLRLIDDFLVISTDRSIAERFMHVMHAGIPEYGVQVKAEKSRANFDVLVQGKAIARLPQHSDFAYCGHAINTVTLDLSKDHERRRKTNIADSVTVDFSRLPGQTFYRKTLNAVKLQMHAMLLSTKYNSVQTVWANLYHSFSEIALKSYHYIHSLPAGKEPGEGLVVSKSTSPLTLNQLCPRAEAAGTQPGTRDSNADVGPIVTGTLDEVVKLACVLMKRRKRTSKDVLPYECCASNGQARW